MNIITMEDILSCLEILLLIPMGMIGASLTIAIFRLWFFLGELAENQWRKFVHKFGKKTLTEELEEFFNGDM